MKRFSFIIILTAVVLSLGCSQRYSLERRLYFLEKKALEAVADPNQIVDAQINNLMRETDLLLPSAESRGLGSRALLLKAILLSSQGKDNQSMDLASEIGDKKGKFAFLDGLGKWYMKKRDYKNALRCFSQEMELVKGSPFYYKGLVNLYLVAKQAGKADDYGKMVTQAFEKAMSSQKPLERYLGEKGMANFKLVTGDLQGALEIMNSIEENGKYPLQLRAKALIDRMTIFLKEGNIADAKAEVKKASGLKMPGKLIERMNQMVNAVEKKGEKQPKQ